MAREPLAMPLGGPGDGVTASTKSATSVAKSSPRLSTLPATFDLTQRSALLRAISVVRPTHASLNFCEPAWLLGDEFDVDALESSISLALSEWSLQQPVVDAIPGFLAAERVTLDCPHVRLPWSLETVHRVQQKWHTRVSRAVTPHSSSSQLPDQVIVDERYREGLTHRLQPRVSNAALPSANFLNLCIKLYFTKFNPIFPIIHAPTFRPSSDIALLLLSISSVGALFVGSAGAAAQGRRIFQILNKAILASWEDYIGGNGREPLSLVQAAIIGQTFGMLSGEPQDLRMTESFHGTVIAWARQAGLFNVKDSLDVLRAAEPSSDLDTVWRRWAQAEESIRLVHGLHVHDMEFATSFHHEPLLRYSNERLPVCSSEELFAAASASHWRGFVASLQGLSSTIAQPMSNHDTSNLGLTTATVARRSQMFPYASLAGIISSIQERSPPFPSDTSVCYFRERLLEWHADYCRLEDDNDDSGGGGSAAPASTTTRPTTTAREHHSKPLNLTALWHMAFMCLYVNFDQLERAFGRDGARAAEQAHLELRQGWVTTSEARCAFLHALLVLRHMESLPSGAEPAIHAPKVLLYAALVLHYYHSHYCSALGLRPAADTWEPLHGETLRPEFQVEPRSPAGAYRLSWPALFARVDSSMLCSAVDLLRRLGRWEIALRYAATLENLVDDFAKP
ncbi:DNA binding [Microdochium nivale]|nr:DNA binding [Microdochium nivale]